MSEPGARAAAVRRSLRAAALVGLLPAAAYALLWLAGGGMYAQLEAARCAPLSVVDRAGRLLRELPAASAPALPKRTARWVPLAELPPLVTSMLVAAEDARFELHPGVDPLAIGRAALANWRSGERRSGASTISMQLVRMLRPSLRERSYLGKLEQAILALALERRASKAQILEAYLNLAYFGAGAHGLAAASRAYFDTPVAALSDAESGLLAVLPRAPRAYDPRRHLERALRRRAYVLERSVQLGRLSAAARAAIEAEPLAIRPEPPAKPDRAGHFVDWVLAVLPEAERARGGRLETTLDLELQTRVERMVREHVATHAPHGVSEAGVVVLDAESGAVRALQGSSDYASSKLNIVTRRRQLGSLLKPFVYALAIEAGESPDSLALDIGGPSQPSRDWVGREAGPLTQREALAGSYNLAAVNVLERVGVAALHARLRRAGVAELASAPARYGLALALGAANVRLLDVASGYGFLVRRGSVRHAYGIERLAREDGSSLVPERRRALGVFEPRASFQVMRMLSDAPARHRRFGRGLPMESVAAGSVVAKTGTASGMSDLSAILACREYIVAAWAGRFDGAPTQGTSGMWIAAPLARRALEAALRGKRPTLPTEPDFRLPVEPVDASRSDESPTTTPRAPPSPEIEAWAERARVPHTRVPR